MHRFLLISLLGINNSPFFFKNLNLFVIFIFTIFVILFFLKIILITDAKFF